jgi:hypothetical protein
VLHALCGGMYYYFFHYSPGNLMSPTSNSKLPYM